jgi:hypothetical protein
MSLIFLGFLIMAFAMSRIMQDVFFALGGGVAAMGLTLFFAALWIQNNVSKRDDQPEEAHPLAHVMMEIAYSQESEKRLDGNRAFGFVLIALGMFMLAVAGVFGLFAVLWPLSMAGTGALTGGAILYDWEKRKT